jgi:hypothetical protein
VKLAFARLRGLRALADVGGACLPGKRSRPCTARTNIGGPEDVGPASSGQNPSALRVDSHSWRSGRGAAPQVNMRSCSVGGQGPY